MKKGSILLVAVLGLLVLSGCSKKKVVTVDASVDYQSARSLPALKRTPVNTSPSQPVIEQPVPSVSAQQVNALIETDSKGIERLKLDGDFDASWAYLNDKMKQANITVYARNESAGLFSVGCGDIQSVESDVVKKGGWTILKRKKKIIREAEYCGLQTNARRNSTTVTFIDRFGNPVGGNFVNDLFKRILNN